MTIVFASVFSGIDVMWDKQFGFLKETLVAPVPRWALMAGRTLGAATVAVFQGVLVLLITFAFGFQPGSWWMLVPALVVMMLVAIIFTAFGTAVGARLSDMQGFQLIMNFIVMPLVFLSGALFPLTGLPTAMYAIVRANPVSYGVDALRTLLIDAGSFGLVADFAVLIAFTAALVAVGTYLFSKIEV
jgi:ABC-2 type transport system permease protein